MDRFKKGINNNKKFCIILTLFLFVFICSSFVTYITYVKSFLPNDNIVYKVRTKAEQGVSLENNVFKQEIDNVSSSLTGVGLSLKNVDKNSDSILNVSIKSQEGSLIRKWSMKEKDLKRQIKSLYKHSFTY